MEKKEEERWIVVSSTHGTKVKRRVVEIGHSKREKLRNMADGVNSRGRGKDRTTE